MKMLRTSSSIVALLPILLGTLAAAACGSSSTPSSPTPTGPGISGVTLSASRIGVGGTSQGTVTLAAAATAASSIALTSSNPAVVSVQSPVAVQAGATTAAFTVTGVAAGTATISASLNNTSGQSPSVTVASVAVATLSLSASTAVGGNAVTATVGLTAPAPAAGAGVTLTASDPLSVPSTVMVPAGASSATFSVLTRLVGGTIPGTVTAAFGGGTASATLSVTKPTVATANFGVTGPTESDTCSIVSGGAAFNCTFNGSTSTAPGNIVAWDWTFKVGTGGPLSQTATSAVLVNPAINCSLFPPPPLPAGGNLWLPLTVTLKVRDDQGNVSAEFSNNGGARVFPQGACGY